MANQSSTPFDQGLFLVHLNRGREHFSSRNFADAAEELEEALRLRPQDETVLNLLGLAYFKQERFKDADVAYRKLIELNPESATLYFNLGLVCFKLGDLDRAEATFLKTLELKSDNQKTHFYLGNIYEKKKQYYNAIFQYRKAGANIMVKRVQEKIDRERPQERGESDFSVETPHPQEPRPKIAVEVDAERTSPDLELDKVNVDHIDRRLFLSALQEGLFPSSPGPAVGKPDPDTAEHDTPASATAPAIRMPEPEIPASQSPSPSDTQAPRSRKSADTQETTLSPDEVLALASEVEEDAAKDPKRQRRPDKDNLTATPSPPAPSRSTADTGRFQASEAEWNRDETVPPTPKSGIGSRIRLSEPILHDESLAEMARGKVPARASHELFSEPGAGPEGRPSKASASASASAASAPAPPQAEADELKWHTSAAGAGPDEPHVYARGRRKDDLFRYLENNLMEVNFSGKVFIKQGTIYSYSGNLTFWVKPQRETRVPPLVIVSGTGKLLLTDRERDISVLQIDDDKIFVEPSHLLACQETLTPRFAVVEKETGGDGLHVLMIEGTGMIALSVKTRPLVLTVQKEYPVNVASGSLISWTGELTPSIVEDEALAEIMLPGSSRGINLRLEGEGRVMVEKTSRGSHEDHGA